MRLRTLLILILLYAGHVYAQTPPGDCPCDPDDPFYDACAAVNPDCDPVDSIPIGDASHWLCVGGALLGFYVTHKKISPVKNQIAEFNKKGDA